MLTKSAFRLGVSCPCSKALMKSPINCISKKLDIYDSLLSPIYIPLNVEKSEVLREVKLQIQTIVNYIGQFQ